MNRLTLLIVCCLLAPSLHGAAPNYQDHILPIFRRHCLGCHNADKKKADLNLSSFQDVSAGSSGGPIVKAGLPDTSLLSMAVNHHEDAAPMPPNKPKLAAADLKTIHDWIAGGLIATAGGKSQLREMSIGVSAGSKERPANPVFPTDLPSVPLAKTLASPPVIAMACSPWADLVAISGHGQGLLFGRAGSADDYSRLGILPFNEGDIHDLRFSRSGELLIAAGGFAADSGKVVIYDVKTGRQIGKIGDEYDTILSADISADQKYVAIGTTSKMVKIYSTTNGELVHRIDKHTDWVTVVRFSPAGKQLATGDRNGGVYVWETATAGIVYALDEHKQKVTALAWRGDAKILASAAEDGKFVLWDMNDGWATRSVTAHAAKSESRYSRRTGVLDIAFARDGRLLTVGRDRTVRLFKPDGNASGKPVDLPALPLRVAVNPDGDRALVGDFEGHLHVFSLPELKELQIH